MRQSKHRIAKEKMVVRIMPTTVRAITAKDILSRSSMVEVATAVRLPKLWALKYPMGIYFMRSPIWMRFSAHIR